MNICRGYFDATIAQMFIVKGYEYLKKYARVHVKSESL